MSGLELERNESEKEVKSNIRNQRKFREMEAKRKTMKTRSLMEHEEKMDDEKKGKALRGKKKKEAEQKKKLMVKQLKKDLLEKIKLEEETVVRSPYKRMNGGQRIMKLGLEQFEKDHGEHMRSVYKAVPRTDVECHICLSRDHWTSLCPYSRKLKPGVILGPYAQILCLCCGGEMPHKGEPGVHWDARAIVRDAFSYPSLEEQLKQMNLTPEQLKLTNYTPKPKPENAPKK